uniref:G domain-containing protein n=1 Tax=Clytia hemisphaerica TaxID=252671 RepID=A0A7M5XC70_9CNID|eukprot:TCONS_00068694-protein
MATANRFASTNGVHSNGLQRNGAIPNKKVGKYLLVAGNPGSGKSTVLNCLMQSRSSEMLQEDQRFQSGVSIGSGMTYQLDVKELNGIVYMDTPGLDDIDKRKQAAEAITQALKRDGSYQIIFVVTLEAGRVRPADVATISLILDSAPEITNYGVIFNKLSKPVLRELTKENKLSLLTQVSARTTEGKKKPLPIPLYLEKNSDLEDEKNAIASLPGLEEYVLCLAPIVIHSNQVDDIPAESFDNIKAKLEEQLDYYRKNQEAMKYQMEEDRKNFKRQYDEMQVENERRHQREMQEIERKEKQHQHEMRALKEQNDQNLKAIKVNFQRENEAARAEAQRREQEMARLKENFDEMKIQADQREQEKRQAEMEEERRRLEASLEEERRQKEYDERLAKMQAAQERQVKELQQKIEDHQKEKARMEEENKTRIVALESKKEDNGILDQIVNAFAGAVKGVANFFGIKF